MNLVFTAATSGSHTLWTCNFSNPLDAGVTTGAPDSGPGDHATHNIDACSTGEAVRVDVSFGRKTNRCLPGAVSRVCGLPSSPCFISFRTCHTAHRFTNPCSFSVSALGLTLNPQMVAGESLSITVSPISLMGVPACVNNDWTTSGNGEFPCSNHHDANCGDFDDADFTASVQCCACGGGGTWVGHTKRDTLGLLRTYLCPL